VFSSNESFFCNDSHHLPLVICYKTDSEYTQTGKITAEIKRTIQNLYAMKIKPKAILQEIIKNGCLIKISKLRNALQQVKIKDCVG